MTLTNYEECGSRGGPGSRTSPSGPRRPEAEADGSRREKVTDQESGRGARDAGLGVQVGFAEARGDAASTVILELRLLPESRRFDVIDPAHSSWKIARDWITARPSG